MPKINLSISVPDNDDIRVNIPQISFVDNLKDKLKNPDATMASLGEEGLNLLLSILSEIQVRQAVALRGDLDSDGLPQEGSDTVELSPEQAQMIQTLKGRFDENSHKIDFLGIQWDAVEAKLRAHPEKLAALMEMEKSGGEPHFTGYENGEYLFDELAKQMPSDRRNLNYDKALRRVLNMGNGVALMTKERYMQLGNVSMDCGTLVWLNTPQDILNAGYALYGLQYVGDACVYQYVARGHDPDGAFRCSLRV